MEEEIDKFEVNADKQLEKAYLKNNQYKKGLV
jgi:hypothetical protein